ncbi:hypothetical protein GGX14DRAFT_40062 [Mycena pura]|uniref:Uncharacterized protein n=1 Tax=Mycena pura TaxID=153505 RepID=A0AAD6URP2_9AGAR|nr:hypothetical protein GGX14DRAFT_40062 [Mycena pura]
MQRIGSFLKDPDKDLRQAALDCLITFLQSSTLVAVLSTPDSLVYFLDILDGRDGDTQILEFMNRLLATASDASVLRTLLIQQTLQKIPRVCAGSRKSYTKLIMMLPPSFPISPDHTKSVISLLRSPELAVLQNVVSIVTHLSANAQFREALLKTNVWETLLRRSDSARLVPEMLEHFARHGGLRINAASGIVPELLNMLRADLDRWETGLRGLLVLGLL